MNAGTLRLASISLAPVKSTALRHVRHAHVGWSGLVGDREWMVVDDGGAEVTARDVPALLRVVASTAATGREGRSGLRLDAPGVEGVDVAQPVTGDRRVRLFGEELHARPAGAHADAWLRGVVGRDDVSLVWCAAPQDRQVAFGDRSTDSAAFQDESAVSLVSAASIAQLDEWIGGAEPPVPPARFRTNLLVEGAAAFAEDGWDALRIGDVELRVAGPISRCVMTLIDPLTLERRREPLRSLARHRRRDGRAWFAVHLLVDRPGSIAVGDTVETS